MPVWCNMKAKRRIKKQKLGYVNDSQLWPRKEAARILSLNTRKEMTAELDKIAEPWRDWVKAYLNDWSRKAGGLAKLQAKLKS